MQLLHPAEPGPTQAVALFVHLGTSQSMAFFSAPEMEWLYLGATNTKLSQLAPSRLPTCTDSYSYSRPSAAG